MKLRRRRNMSRVVSTTGIADFDAVRSLSQAQRISSSGATAKLPSLKQSTIEPKNQSDGLFCERIFGPVKDINPHDSKLKGVRFVEAAVDKNGELVTKPIVRRERRAHLEEVAPVAHIWFMRGTPRNELAAWYYCP